MRLNRHWVVATLRRLRAPTGRDGVSQLVTTTWRPLRGWAGRFSPSARRKAAVWLVAAMLSPGVRPTCGSAAAATLSDSLARTSGDSAAVSTPQASAVAPAPGTAPAPAPVIVAGDTILFLRARLGAFSPAERARAIALRTRAVARDVRFGTDSVVVADGDAGSDIAVGDVILMTVTDADAAAAGTPRAELARRWAAALEASMAEAGHWSRLKSLLMAGAWALLATGILILALKVLSSIFARGMRRLQTWRAVHTTGLRIQRLEILSAEQLSEALFTLARFVRIAVIVVLFYVYLPLVLSLFPWTRPLAGKLTGYVVAPLARAGNGFLEYLPNLFFVVGVLVISRYVMKLVHVFFRATEQGKVVLPGLHRDLAEPTYKIAQLLIVVFAAVVIFPYLPGANSPGFKNISIFLGVLLSLGSSSAIANSVAGVVLTYTRAFGAGDRVKIADTTGDVVAKSLLVTRIRTIKNVEVTVPNAMVLGSHIVNYSRLAASEGVILHTTVTIGYDAPWARVHELLIAAANATEHILKQPAPFILQTHLGDFYVSYELNAYTGKPHLMAKIYSDLHQNIQDAFNAGGVEIMSPHYASLRDGNQTTIPAPQLPADYVAPPFRVQTQVGPPARPSAS